MQLRVWIFAAAALAASLPAFAQDAVAEPTGLSDADLELAVRAAYVAAAAYSRGHGNYFARDGAFGPVRDTIAAALAKDFPGAVVPSSAASSFDAAQTCLAAPGTELRMATNSVGDGLTLVAVTDKRMFAYRYDPHEAPEIVVAPAADCLKR